MKEITSLKKFVKMANKERYDKLLRKVSCFGKLTYSALIQVHPVTTEHNSL